MHARLIIVALGVLPIAGCACDPAKCMGSGTFVPDCSHDDVPPECTGGETRACFCPGWGGTGGVSRCSGSEMFGPCECPPPPTCGDTVCEGLERMECTSDCMAVCGDGLCEPLLAETAATCPGDCPLECGDDVCDARGETETTCPMDCTMRCGDSRCDAPLGEMCALDCGTTCGDGLCELGDAPDCADCARTCTERARWTTGLGAALGGPGPSAPAMAFDGEVRVATADARGVMLATMDGAVVADWIELEGRTGFPPSLVPGAGGLLLGSLLFGRAGIDVIPADGSPMMNHILSTAAIEPPALAWDAGQGIAAWVDTRGGLQVAVLDAAGMPAAMPTAIPATPRGRPAVAAGPSSWLVAWPEFAGDVLTYRAVIHDWSGARIGAVDPLERIPSARVAPSPAVVWTGAHFVVAWSGSIGVAWAVVAPDGTVARRESPRRVLAPSNHVALAVTGDRLTLVDAVHDGSVTTTFVAELTLDGAPMGAAVPLTCNPGSEENPAVTHDTSTATTFVTYLRRETPTASVELAIAELAPSP